ncbi:hypothetical protein AAGW05_10580 [Arthrobacter sp. LAPM80]|uniref:hypothetical protein n=1 Tax=Arthrobacter sp. LAPM80 TaxID=3141788 RepID=UPI00398AEC2C
MTGVQEGAGAVPVDDGAGSGSPGEARVEPVDADVQSTMEKFLAVVASIGPPVTVATALLVYFGWARSDAQARAMGLDVSLFGYTVQDYALRSIRSLFLPLVCLLIAGLLWLAADGWLRGQIPSGQRSALVARMSTAALASGVLLAAGCLLLAVVRPGGVFLVVPFLMAGGVLLASWGVRLRRLTVAGNRPRATGRSAVQHRALEATFVFTLVTVLLFWGTSEFAQVVGRGQAAAVEASLPALPRADVYSNAALSIGAPGVRQSVLGPAGAPVYKYTGMHLLVASGGRFFLLPDSWTLSHGTVVVLPDNNAVRVEFGKH